MTFDIGLHEVCVRTGVRYVITKFSGMDSLPNFLTHGAPLRARELRYDWLCRRLVYRVEKSQVLLTEDALKISYNVLLLNLHYSLIKSQTLVEQHYYSIP